MTGFLRRATTMELRRPIFAHPRPLPQRHVALHPYARIILPLDREKHVLFGTGSETVELTIAPGDVIFCRPGAWVEERWDLYHSMISLVFYEKYTRFIYIDQSDDTPRHGPDVYFHSRFPPPPVIRAALDMLNRMNDANPAALAGIRTLLLLALDLIEQEDDTLVTEEDRIWNRVAETLNIQFGYDLAREDIAARAGIPPARLSKLMRARTGMNVREYLTRLRLDYAVKLLREPLAVEEISRRCGFSYPAYFIRLFREHYGETPGEFRKQL